MTKYYTYKGEQLTKKEVDDEKKREARWEKTIQEMVDSWLRICSRNTYKAGYTNFEKLGGIVHQIGRVPHNSQRNRNLAMKIARSHLLRRCGL
jgi:protein-arginine kinase activator protein McsA